MKMLFVILALTTLTIANPAMAQYSAPDSVPGYNWREQRGSLGWAYQHLARATVRSRLAEQSMATTARERGFAAA